MIIKPWRTEYLKLLGLALAVLFIWHLTGLWVLAIAVTLTAYILYLLYQLHQLHQWLSADMPITETPYTSGILGQIIHLIYRSKKDSEATNQAQQAFTEQLNETISAIPSATIILNRHNEIEWANFSALSLLGINGQRDVGIRIENLLRQQEFVSLLNQSNNEQFEINSPVTPNLTLAVQVVRYAERRRLLIAHNITPHIEVQRSRKIFIANASHELRTPLTVVAGYLEFMQSDPLLPDGLKHPIEKAIEQTDNMELLINDLLVLSKIEGRSLQKQHLSKINLFDYNHTIMQTLADSGKTKNHKLTSQVPKNLSINASEKELNSVCYNLITNAIKYSEPDSNIDITWQQSSKGFVSFRVTDQGIGIAPEHISHLTERFYRVDSGRSRRVGGTGLGLAIVKHIVERHNGILEINSKLGEGSTFSATFPIHPLK